MAPKTVMTPDQVAAFREIERVHQEGLGTPVGFEPPKKHNGFFNHHPKINADVGSVTFDEDTKLYIADAWPRDHDSHLLVIAHRRVEQGSGPRVSGVRILPDGTTEYGSMLAPTKRHWTRPIRRVEAAIGRRSRRRNEIARRKPVKQLRALRPIKGPTQRKTKGPEPSEKGATA